jgi:hypothetical protein
MQSAYFRPFASLAFVFATACAAGNADQGSGGGGQSSTSTSTGTSASTATGSTGSGFTSGTMSSGSGGQMQIAEVFGHSIDTLYRLDPDTKAVSTVAAFSGCEVTGSSNGIMDIALDKDSHLYATSHLGLYLVDKDTAACSKIAPGDYPNSLSFVPAGTLDPNVEALVGYVIDSNNKNQYVRINTTTGAITNVGAPWTDSYVSSGDIVSVKNGPTYLTIKGGDCSPYDCLAEINPQTGKMVTNYGQIDGYSKVFGLAFWAGESYGFTADGQLFDLKIMGNALITTPVSTPAGLVFWGAGSTTSAPPVPQ